MCGQYVKIHQAVLLCKAHFLEVDFILREQSFLEKEKKEKTVLRFRLAKVQGLTGSQMTQW